MKKPKKIPLRVQAIRASQLKIGTPVVVLCDDGTTITSEVTSDPWQLGHGSFVVNCKGFRAFDVMRVRPA